ncbi:MAG TPA: histidine kinase dimerization/phospho-acceptor domain-containing protein [Oceanobacillus sp.]|nr:histidine kinase dimerization/phospho-acceptor domain-containing protein [Oceanobacillus sp.]
MSEISNEAIRDKILQYTPDDFFHLMAHDLRAPLSNIMGVLSLLKDHPTYPLSDTEYAACMRIIEESAERLDLMIDGALEYGRIQYHKCKKTTGTPA